jgi:hypothetical protein
MSEVAKILNNKTNYTAENISVYFLKITLSEI